MAADLLQQVERLTERFKEPEVDHKGQLATRVQHDEFTLARARSEYPGSPSAPVSRDGTLLASPHQSKGAKPRRSSSARMSSAFAAGVVAVVSMSKRSPAGGSNSLTCSRCDL